MIFRRYRRIIKELRKVNQEQYDRLWNKVSIKNKEIQRMREENHYRMKSVKDDRQYYIDLSDSLLKEQEQNQKYKDKYIKLLAALEVKGVEITFNED